MKEEPNRDLVQLENALSLAKRNAATLAQICSEARTERETLLKALAHVDKELQRVCRTGRATHAFCSRLQRFTTLILDDFRDVRGGYQGVVLHSGR